MKVIKNFLKFVNITPLQKDGYQNLHLNFLEKAYKISFKKEFKCYAIFKNSLYLFFVKKGLEKQYEHKLFKPFVTQKIHWWKNRDISFVILGKKLQRLAGVYGKPLKVSDIDGNGEWFLLKLEEDKDNGK